MALTPGGYGQIFVDMDTVSRMLSRLLSNLDEFPDPDAVARTSGPNHGAASIYSSALADAANRARVATVRTREHLLEMDQAIREVVTALTEHDTSATADAKRLFEVLDDAATDAKAVAPIGGTGEAHSSDGTSSSFGSLA
ncbi:MAG: hypothetical protein HGA51_00755 [Demequinaceae bacterium]|nr:hypothetical protein [Demequinaceae bacterium]